MQDKIKEILIRNNMYSSYGSIVQNKTDEFLNNYVYNDSCNHILPENLRRSKNGSLILDDIPFIISNPNGKGKRKHKFILLSNGSKILIKNINEDKIKEEILIMYFLRQLDLNCASYDKISIHGNTYLSSNCFINNDETIENPFIRSFNNIKQMLNIADFYDRKDFYLKTVFADRIYGNSDRENNFSIIKSNSISYDFLRFAPLYDNAEYTLNRSLKYGYLPRIDKNEDMNFVINYLLDFPEIINWINMYVSKSNLSNAAEKMYKEKNMFITSNIYNEYETYFKDSEYIINEELKKKGKALKISLT